jgi:hypothetical protein
MIRVKPACWPILLINGWQWYNANEHEVDGMCKVAWMIRYTDTHIRLGLRIQTSDSNKNLNCSAELWMELADDAFRISHSRLLS